MSRRGRVAFVLAGGASLGAVEVGMLRALYERGIAADFLVATSAGALNGAFVASRPQTVQTADALGDVWRGLRRGQVFAQPAHRPPRLHRLARPPRARLGLRRIVSRHVGHEQLEDMPLP